MDSSEIRIDLSGHKDKYSDDSLELQISKKVNFIFGKNGSGKTTISDEILKQFSDTYSVHVFKDFDGVATNERLDAVALGTKNAAIQKQIDAVDVDIANLKKEVDKPDDDAENLYTTALAAKKSYDDQSSKLDRFYRLSASQIKGQSNPQIANPSYNLNDFKREISSAKALDDEEIRTHKDTIRADKKADIAPVALLNINLNDRLLLTNNILRSKVNQAILLPELEGNQQKQQFAKMGKDIHEHKAGELCAFCGNEITDERWAALGNHFNTEVKKLEEQIDDQIALIQRDLSSLNSIEEIDRHLYYGKYTSQIKTLNTSIKLRKVAHENYLNDLKSALKEKKNNLFIEIDELELQTPENFNNAQLEYITLIESNNKFSEDLASEQDKARDALRYHEVKNKLEAFQHSEQLTSLIVLDKLRKSSQDALNERRRDLEAKEQKRLDLISQTKNEKKIAIKINGLLKGMGVTSFELELVNDEDEQQKGQYKIKSYDGSIRSVTALSKGEKNIIAFLYFIFDLERTDVQNKSKIIVLDDPMSSNDDTMQYIMISEIQKCYRKIKDGSFFILLTHNTHFYLNARPKTTTRYKIKVVGKEKQISFYKKYGVWHLYSDGKRSTLRPITKGKYDFGTSYETLWRELSFLFNATEATPDLMLAPCRKICETYMHFSKKSTDQFYDNNLSAKKLFDVNQHSIDDLEAELNGKTKEEIRDTLKALFAHNNADDHFSNYWKENS